MDFGRKLQTLRAAPGTKPLSEMNNGWLLQEYRKAKNTKDTQRKRSLMDEIRRRGATNERMKSVANAKNSIPKGISGMGRAANKNRLTKRRNQVLNTAIRNLQKGPLEATQPLKQDPMNLKNAAISAIGRLSNTSLLERKLNVAIAAAKNCCGDPPLNAMQATGVPANVAMAVANDAVATQNFGLQQANQTLSQLERNSENPFSPNVPQLSNNESIVTNNRGNLNMNNLTQKLQKVANNQFTEDEEKRYNAMINLGQTNENARAFIQQNRNMGRNKPIRGGGCGCGLKFSGGKRRVTRKH